MTAYPGSRVFLLLALGLSATARHQGTVPNSPRVTVSPPKTVAVVGDHLVSLDSLAPALLETGGVVLEEFVLDRMIERELASASVTVSEADVARERGTLVDSLRRDAAAAADDAETLIEEIRRARGLGDTRFRAQLARTAALRKLVAADVAVTEDEVRTAHEMRHGVSFVTRVILMEDEREISRVWSELSAGKPEGLAGRFSDAAVKNSRDPSAARGGLLGPVSPADPTYPAAIRSLLTETRPGTLSPIVALERGHAFVLVEERVEGDGKTVDETAAGLREELTRRRERLAMDELARRLLATAKVSVMDAGLRWAWEARRR